MVWSRLLPERTATALPSVDVLAALLCVLLAVLIMTKRLKRKPPTVSGLFIYPIKSCAETQLESACVTARGLEHDRIMQCTSTATDKVCTPRDDSSARLFHLTPKIDANGCLTLAAPGADEMKIDLNTARTQPRLCGLISALGPEAVQLMLDDYGDAAAAWLEAATGIRGARLTGVPADFKRRMVVNPDQREPFPADVAGPLTLADEAPFLLCSVESLADLNHRLAKRGKSKVDMRRFRPNIVITGLKPWEEDCIKRVRIGGVPFHAWQRCGRCKMTTIDRDNLTHGPEPLATLSTFRERARGQRNFGVHLVLAEEGLPETTTISSGAQVEILEYDEERRAEWQRLFG